MVVPVGCQQDAEAAIVANAVRDLVAVCNSDFFRQSGAVDPGDAAVIFARLTATLTRKG